MPELTESVRSTDSGAVVLFLGTVREMTEGRRTDSLDYEAFGPMAQKKLDEIEAEVRRRWPLDRVAIVHRTGRLELGEVSVAVAVSRPHRREAFDAARYLIDTLKETVPIWKNDPEHIRWHVRFLSHDLLEGRGTGQRGGDIAAEYIATQFAEYGLKPAGDNGSYLQKVPLVGITTLPQTQFVLLPKHGPSMDLKPLDEYVAYDQTQQLQSDVDAEIVYVGYGIEAPEYNWDDYKGVDVRGKVLLMLVNEPPSDDSKFFKAKR